jgi:acetyl-CoA carboxylase biotin carboxyl carrier protein
VSIDFNQIRELLVTISQTGITEFILKSDEFELTVRKEIPILQTTPAPVVASSPVVVSSTPQPLVQELVTTANSSAPTETATSSPSPIEKKWVEITSPMVGTFYRAPAPDEPPFVEVGDRISVGQTVCILEAMKLMNEIESEISGQIMEIMVENGEPVEYGQILMWVNPG